jgi:uncharacterized cupredoxin-like copper-binding protein
MKVVFAALSIVLAVAATRVCAHDADQRQPGHDDAFGRPGDSAKVSRTIDVEMNDTMRFIPEKIAVKKGQTVRFLVKNAGRLKHEMVLGTAKELREHAELMKKFPEMEHDDLNELSLDGGKTGELVWQFTKAGTFDFACLQPGHYGAGMHGKIAVR